MQDPRDLKDCHADGVRFTGAGAFSFTTTSEICEAVPSRARIQGARTFVSLNSRLESNKKEERTARGSRGRGCFPSVGLVDYG